MSVTRERIACRHTRVIVGRLKALQWRGWDGDNQSWLLLRDSYERLYERALKAESLEETAEANEEGVEEVICLGDNGAEQ